MDSFVYKWTNLTLGKIYIGFHKGSENDGYICSSRSEEFWNDFGNTQYKWEREILFRGLMRECQLMESKLLNDLDITSNFVYNNKNNLMFNLNDEVRLKLKRAAKKRSENPEYIKGLSDRAKRQWEDPEHRKRVILANTGKTLTDITIDKIKIARGKQIITSESRQKAAKKITGVPRPQNVRDSISLGRYNAPEVTCPHCGKIGKYGGSMSRWHFDRCRDKK